ncbi:MAG: acetyl-CoA carboxylase biotin carboxyl carrier protein [Armatimonadetes bacterium]|nr:acetyl-CoA carboxylase biotin carboxyl carrier protein [Armatimonadota bacterium]
MEPNKIDLDQVRAVMKIASEAADIAELTVETPTLKVSVKKTAGRMEVQALSNPGGRAAGMGTLAAAPGPAAVPAGRPSGTAGAEPLLPDHMKAVTAPMVGTFYRAPSPDAPPFVMEGDQIDAGQPVCIIEAMKLFNEIQSDVRGRVARVLVENGTPVEYGQPLLLIEPLA